MGGGQAGVPDSGWHTPSASLHGLHGPEGTDGVTRAWAVAVTRPDELQAGRKDGSLGGGLQKQLH